MKIKRPPQKRLFRQPLHLSGATLIEVMVSVFLLTFGVLALMAAQIRSVGGIGEAESRSTIAQATETLAEGMLANPSVIDINKRAVRRYPNYTTTRRNTQTVDLSNVGTLPNPLWGTTWEDISPQTQSNISKQALADSQVSLFEHMLRQTPNAQTIQYVICEDSAQPPRAPTHDANGNIRNANCAAANATDSNTVIKVVWTTRPAKAGARVPVYTYQLQVQE